MAKAVTFEDGQVFLGDWAVPGILVRQSVRGAVRFDEAEQDGLSGKAKLAKGWEDADVQLTIDLLTDSSSTCYEKLALIDGVFKGVDNKGNPQVFDVRNSHLLVRGVRQVVFSGLNSEESDRDDTIRATLRFVEHIPVITRAEERAIAAQQSQAPEISPAKTAEPELDPALKVNLEAE
ncbi:MAG: hypothetical protein HQL53_13785 [Magnetococcales bacterium]|nr:hypothetical protein [Magnetococcales bacterium]